MIEKRTIQTQNGEKIVACIYTPLQKAQGIVFIAHGLAGYKEEKQLEIIKEVFLNQKTTVVLYDARYTLGESDGPLEKACFTNFIQDLTTVIQWSKAQSFYREPFFLAGHSLGAGACLHYGIHHPEQVRGIICLSAVYNGQFLLDSYTASKPDFVQKWQKEKLLFRQRSDITEKSGYISYNHMIDACTYHLETEANKIICPVLIICGDHDISSTVFINKCLYYALTTKKTLEILPNCGHNYTTDQNKSDLRQAVQIWLANNI